MNADIKFTINEIQSKIKIDDMIIKCYYLYMGKGRNKTAVEKVIEPLITVKKMNKQEAETLFIITNNIPSSFMKLNIPLFIYNVN